VPQLIRRAQGFSFVSVLSSHETSLWLSNVDKIHVNPIPSLNIPRIPEDSFGFLWILEDGTGRDGTGWNGIRDGIVMGS
jgi:hypothetical protein